MPVSAEDLSDATTIAETAEMLGITYRHMRRIIQSGQIDHIRIGQPRGKVLITRAAFNDYLNRHNNKTTVPRTIRTKAVRTKTAGNP